MEQIKDLMKDIVSCVSAQAKNLDKADVREMAEAMDMIKDLAMAEYYCVVTKAMEDPDNVYGEDWDEKGRIKKGYRKMYTTRGYDDLTQDKSENVVNRAYGGNRGYEEMKAYGGRRGYEGGKGYDSARRGYEESKDADSLNHLFDVIEKDMEELKDSMSSKDIQTAHHRLSSLANKVIV